MLPASTQPVLAPIFLVLAAAFGGTACGGPATERLHGHWIYASGESEGRTASVSGDLKFTPDGKFDDSRRIGGIGGYRKGTYKVSGDKLTLSYDGGKNSQTYVFSFGTSTDAAGKSFTTLLLRGTGLSFVLTKKEP
jgi:hypothetical protein